MKHVLAGFCVIGTVGLACPVVAQQLPKDCVILLHGLARSQASFALMEAALEREGYAVRRPGYASTKADIPTLAEAVIPPTLAECPAGQIHFVTHSMGGILVREWLSHHDLPQLGHVVMLGPPNQGSEVVDKFGDFEVFGQLNGPAGTQLGTGENSLPRHLPPVTYPTGVIAGNQSLNAYFSTLLPGPDDGKVSVQSTAVAGMQDHITLPVTHTFMMNNPRVISEVILFLQDGAFDDTLSWGEAVLDRLEGTFDVRD